MADKKVYIAVALIAVVAVAAIGAYFIFSNNGAYDGYKDKYMEFEVTASGGGIVADGTVKMEVTNVKGSTITMKATFDIYYYPSSVKTPLMVYSETSTFNANEGQFRGVKQADETISTMNWGSKLVDVYIETDSGTTTKYYLDKDNNDVIYQMDMTMTEGYDTLSMSFKLKATNFI
jgi:hypothetical protein